MISHSGTSPTTTSNEALFLIDTHCHLDPQYFPSGADGVLVRAKEAGVRGFVSIGVGRDVQAAHDAVDLAKARPDCVAATVGVHPHDAVTFDDGMTSSLKDLANRSNIVAIGEIGLDYHYMHSAKERQEEVFRDWIRFARVRKLPIVIHTREAADDTLRILKEENAKDVGGIIHCFSEDLAFAKQAMDMNFDISFSGIVTFKTALAIQETAREVPLDRILVETDSPYLAPIPYRGKANEPSYMVHTARKVAELRGISLEALGDATTKNARKRLALPF